MIRCRLLGHRYRFRAEGRVVGWTCERGCGAAGRKAYNTPADAARYARALDAEDRDELGRRAPFGLLPLRIARRVRRP